MPERLHEFLLRLKALLLKRRMDRDMADELAFHQAMLRERMLREGVPQQDADAATRRTFGNPGRWHERLRELWQFRWLEDLERDVSYSTRVLRHSPGFTTVAVITLALGVGANTTVFSIINGLLLRPLPVPASERLALLAMANNDDSLRVHYGFSEPLFRSLERRHQVFSEVFAFNQEKFQIRSSNGTETVPGQFVSGDFFSALQTQPLLGRTLTPADDRKGGNPAGFGVVISEGFWERWFNRSPDVLGRKLQIDNITFTVIGVMPKRFIGADPLQRPEIFAPLATEQLINGARSMISAGVHGWWLTVIGRLQPHATLEEASAQVGSLSSTVLHEATSESQWIAEKERHHFHFVAESGSAGFTYVRLFFRKPLLAVFAMCGGILLLACLNLASLLMARGAARQRELATRLAMGATRRRLLQQLLVESMLIAAAGTAAGLAVAPVVGRSLSLLLVGGQSENHIDTSLDIRVFAFAALVALVATLLVGLVPALQATSSNLNEQIKNGQHSTQAHEHRRILPRMMMASEVALALMLVVGAGLLASSLVRLYKSGVGFDPHGLENIYFSMDQQPLKGDALMQFYREMGDGLRQQPGVQSVSYASIIPFTNQWDESFSGPGGKIYDIYQNSVAPDYFRTMRIPLFEGREFQWNDTIPNGLKVILNQSAAKVLLPDRNPIGQIITKKEGNTSFRYEVVAVVGDAKYEDMRSEPPPTAYMPMTQDNDEHTRSYNAVVRTNGAPGPLASTARTLAERMGATIPAPVMTSMSTSIDESLGAERTMAVLSVFFAICALVVTAIGLYGTLAYATARRTSEIGIRMALGAKRAQVAAMVFRQNSAVALAGTGAGLIAALLASRALASFLYGTSARDPWVFAGSIFALALIAAAASLLPALRAARINPMTAIRCE
jgi:predicted permease